jgi:uncharacterized membrane protein YeaQ/YmgE (transglycosylase-associated protein family)
MSLLLWFLLIGLVVGLLVWQFVKGGKYGILGDIVVGVIGASIGGILYRAIGVPASGNLIDNLIAATIGALALLLILRQFIRA